MSAGPMLIRLFAAILAILIPLIIARYFHHKHGSPWSLFRWGCLTFIISQVFHIPFNAVVFHILGLQGQMPQGASLVYLSIFLGLSAGIFEELTRYLVYRYQLVTPTKRSFKSALMFGLGHGGIESILLVGLGGIAQLVGMTVLRDGDLASMGIPEDQRELVQKQIADYWAVPWYGVLMGDLERIFAITLHVAMTVLVLQAFRRPGGIRWLCIAILCHAGMDFSVVFFSTTYNVYVAELFIALWAIASFGIIRYFALEEGDLHEESIEGTASIASGTATEGITEDEMQRLSND